jgi:hypothetical protein
MHGPMGKYTFIALLFILSGTGFMMGGMTLYENAMFRFKGRDALMVATDPPKWLIVPDGNYQTRTVNVKYVAGITEIPVPAKRVSGDEVRRLAQGERIPVRYIDGDLQHVRIDGEQGDIPWGWLFAGFAGLTLALYARKLAHREARR